MGDAPNEYYCMVHMDKDEIVSNPDGSYAYWLTEDRAAEVIRAIHRDKPHLDLSMYGLAKVVVTKTQFTPERFHTTLNINVLYGFTHIFNGG